MADAILNCAGEHAADINVMSNSGHSGMTRWMLGNVAARVLQGARIPVLLVRPSAVAGRAVVCAMLANAVKWHATTLG